MRRLARSIAGRLLLGFSALVVAVASAHAQSSSKLDDDVQLGVWQMDLAKSRYYPGPPPKSETRTFTRDKDGVKGTVVRQLADGQEERIEYRADFDKEYPVSGTDAYDAVRFRRIDAYTADAVLSHAGRVFGVARRVISRDGKTMTITFKQEEPGLGVSNVVVYQKVK
jgi:hypothetical protein